MKYNISTFPKIIEIQFHNKCNSNCLICPYKDMEYESTYMNDNIFQKFLTQIPNNNLIRIIPYLNNEPFMDKTYIEKLKAIRNKCPNTQIEISTNASLLNEKKIQELKSLSITELRLSVFGYSDSTYTKMMPGLNKTIVFNNLDIISKAFINSKTLVSIVMIDDGSIDEKEFEKMKFLSQKLNFNFERWGFLDRCKNVTYKTNEFYSDIIFGCEQNRPLERMHILANGDVIFCCQDWKHSIVLGNISNNTIEEIWNSEKYNNLRNALYNRNCQTPELCKNCKLSLHD